MRNALQQHGIETSSLIEQSGPWHDQVEQRPFEFALSPNQGKHSPSRIDVRRRAIEQAPSRSDDRNAHRSHRSDSTSRRNRRKITLHYVGFVYASLTCPPALPILPSAPPAEDFTDLSITPTPPPQLNKLDYTSIGVDFVLR